MRQHLKCKYRPDSVHSSPPFQDEFSKILDFCAISCLTTVLVLFFPAALIILGVIPLTATLPAPYFTSSKSPSYWPWVTESFLELDLTGFTVLASLGSDTTDGRCFRRDFLLSSEWCEALSSSASESRVLWERCERECLDAELCLLTAEAESECFLLLCLRREVEEPICEMLSLGTTVSRSSSVSSSISRSSMKSSFLLADERPRMLLTSEVAFDGAFDGALEAGRGGDGEDSMTSEWWLRLCLDLEVCLDASVCDDFALDLLE